MNQLVVSVDVPLKSGMPTTGRAAALTSLLQSVGLRVEAFGSAADFLKKGRLADSVAAACLILDIRLPGVSGLDFQAELAKADSHLPIIFISGHGDIPMTVRAMKAGAFKNPQFCRCEKDSKRPRPL